MSLEAFLALLHSYYMSLPSVSIVEHPHNPGEATVTQSSTHNTLASSSSDLVFQGKEVTLHRQPFIT